MGKAPTWDLSAYYSGLDDPNIRRDMAKAAARAVSFAKKYRGKISAGVKPDFLRQAIRELESIHNLSSRPATYAYQVFSTRMSDHKAAALKQQTEKAYVEAYSKMLFFGLELSALAVSKLKGLASHPSLSNYRNYLANVIQFKPHRLTEPEEKILALKRLTGGDAFVRLFDEHLTAKRFKVKRKDKVLTLSHQETLELLRDPSRPVRKAAALALTAGLNEESRILGYIFNTLGEDKAINDRLARFASPEQSRHKDNEISQEVVEAMSAAVTASYPLVAEYYRFKKRAMGLEVLYDYDRYAPMESSKAKYGFREAEKLVVGSFRKFSAAMAEAAQMFFDKRWIDAMPQAGKRGGAYCSSGTPDKHPVVFMNYAGNIDSVQTLAHELGHGINDWMMRKQTPFNYSTTLVMAETASVFCEMLVFDELRSNMADSKDLLALYMNKVEGIISTVYRQHAMYMFEKAFHQQKKIKGELSLTEIDAIWRQTQIQMYGNSITLTPGYDRWWSYIPHFLHTPFYVYAYAFGELLVLSLYAKYKDEGPSFVPKYLKLMEAGTTASPQELLRPLGINLKDKAFWDGGVQVIRELVREAKKLG